MDTLCTWNGKMGFTSQFGKNSVQMDATQEAGGLAQAPTPKELVLAGICGCTGMDVVALLKKMKAPFESFSIQAHAEKTKGHPSVFSHVSLEFYFVGENPELPEKCLKAVELSQSKYCGVSAMISKTAVITYQIFINKIKTAEGRAQFTF